MLKEWMTQNGARSGTPYLADDARAYLPASQTACIQEAPTGLVISKGTYCTYPGKFKAPIGGGAKAGEARQTIVEMSSQLLELEGEHIEVVQSTAPGKERSVISDAD